MSARPQRCSVAARLFWCVALASLASACGSSSIAVTTPTGSKCSVTVANSMSSVPAGGAAGTLTISTNRDCTWSASTPTPWISITSTPNGQGEATLSYRVAANVDPSPRHGLVTVNDATADVTQEAAPCVFTVTPTTTTSPPAGGSIDVAVAASSPACGWTAVSNTAWITVAGGTNRSGNGTVTLTVLPNGGDAREGRVVVAGEQVTITQPAPASEPPAPMPLPAPTPNPTPAPTQCTYTLDPSTQAIAASGGNGSIAVTSAAGCAWTATTAASWITITAGTGEGTGTVTFSAAANSGAARSATIQIGTSSATITQATVSCSYTIAPTSQSVPATGGTGTVTVTAGSTCAWSATEDVLWISITSGANGTGNGTVQFSVTPNTGSARSATLTIAGKTFTVTQAAAACSYSIAPSRQSVPASGGSGTVTVTAAAGCAWTAASNADWLTITNPNPASGSGNGSIVFNAAANTGGARSGTLSIAGQTFTVTQEATGCSYSISPSIQAVGAAGGTGSVAVSSGAGCPWTAVSNAGWIVVPPGASGTGNGTVRFAVLPNVGAARSGTVTIAGQTFTVTQEGTCTFSVTPTTVTFDEDRNDGTITVTAGSGCSWTATANADWLEIRSGSSGSGNGTVSFRAKKNETGAARTGTLTIAGQTVTIMQEGD
jgi:hypothetical protein